VEYTLTPLGRTLIEPLQAICKWSEKHLSELEANRAKAAKQKVVAAPNGFGADRGGVLAYS
jgi:DNA-binding HxlR family transcriptional regulator